MHACCTRSSMCFGALATHLACIRTSSRMCARALLGSDGVSASCDAARRLGGRQSGVRGGAAAAEHRHAFRLRVGVVLRRRLRGTVRQLHLQQRVAPIAPAPKQPRIVVLLNNMLQVDNRLFHLRAQLNALAKECGFELSRTRTGRNERRARDVGRRPVCAERRWPLFILHCRRYTAACNAAATRSRRAVAIRVEGGVFLRTTTVRTALGHAHVKRAAHARPDVGFTRCSSLFVTRQRRRNNPVSLCRIHKRSSMIRQPTEHGGDGGAGIIIIIFRNAAE